METLQTVLSEEHENILIVIAAVLHECEELEAGKKINTGFFLKVLDFIRNYADGLHHAKEEDILFKTLKQGQVEMHCDPITQMLYEHDKGREFTASLDDAVKTNDAAAVIKYAGSYCQLLRSHIYKEDNILYPMAEEALNDNQKEFIMGKFKDIDLDFTEGIKKQLAFVAELTQQQAQTP